MEKINVTEHLTKTLNEKKLKKKLTPDEEKVLFLIRNEADKLFSSAHERYMERLYRR